MTVIDRRIKNKIKKSFNDQKKKKKREIESIVKQAETHQKKKQK